ncbi:unnamed protein product [Phytophthora lilii]|uniref:Unnamed protein product n=1 Tax=Phytophthora lilii TaxID=2077276 RepID=A0A9W6XBD4_9STRA|nr:unnamed protein product [Phytophthora lilii]
MDSFDLSEQRIVQLEQIPLEIQHQIERGDGNEYGLDLSLNRLRSIDQIGHVNGIQALRRLQTLDLSRNCIATVDLLALLPALQVLKVAENSLTSVDALQLLPELRVVDASYNRITKWPPLAGLSLLELPMLEFLAFDGNPIVIEIVRSGGQLERMLAAFFPCLPLSNDGGLTMLGRRHDEFTTPPHTLNTLKRAILEGREESLTEFLLTGSLAGQGSPGGFGSIFPPPPPVEHLPLHDTGNEQRAIDNTLSHDNKLEIWKRIQEDRKAQFGESSGFVPSSSSVRREKSVRWDQRVEQPVDIRAPALAAADLVTPEPTLQVMPALDASSLSVMKPLNTTILSTPSDPMKGSQAQNNADNEALVKKVKALTEQVRMKSFKKKHVAAIRIQRAWRKIVADRFAIFRGDQKLFRWNRSTTTGNQEFYFKWRGLLNGVVRCSQDVKQLQQVCAVQDDAINSLWSNQNSNDSMNKKNIIRFEVANPTFGDQTDAKADGLLPEMDSVSEVRNLKQQIDRQSIEIDTLKQQLESLQNVVASLASVKLENR